MAKKQGRTPSRHRLLYYVRYGKRLRIPSLLIALFSTGMLVIGWLSQQGILKEQAVFWEIRTYIIMLILFSLLLYAFAVYISRTSYVYPRSKALRVKAGLLAVDISYKRISQIHLTSFAAQYPLDMVKRGALRIVEPFEKLSCSAVIMNSWPWPGEKVLRRMWCRYMFLTQGGKGLLFIVEDPIVLNQQLDGYITAVQSRKIQEARGYADPIERAVRSRRK